MLLLTTASILLSLIPHATHVTAIPAANLEERQANKWIQRMTLTKYSTSQPATSNLVTELNGLSPDLNNCYGGKYAYLTVSPAAGYSDALTALGVYIEDNPRSGFDDFAQGTGGKYRYIWQCKGSSSSADCPKPNAWFGPTAIRKVSLWRPGTAQTSPPSGWHGISGNLNEGRGNWVSEHCERYNIYPDHTSFLYVIWQETN